MNSMISIFLTSNGIDPFYVKTGIVALILILFLSLFLKTCSMYIRKPDW